MSSRNSVRNPCKSGELASNGQIEANLKFGSR
jgi:hypothetical protein